MDWNACLYEPWPLLRWVECHPGFASYLQAVGTVLAVGAGAAMVVWQQSQVRKLAKEASDKAEAERAAKQIALGYRLDFLVDDIKSHYSLVISSHSLFSAGLDLLVQGPARLDDAIKVMIIDVDWGDNIFDDMSVMPRPIQESVITLLGLVANYNRETEAILRHGAKHGVQMISDLPKQSKDMLDQIEYRMDEASGLLERALDSHNA